jgi:drug/metabolite transporter (DMT)-like permease
MLAVGLSLLAGLGFASTAIFARVGMQGVKPLPAAFISVAVSFLPAIILALLFAMPDIRALPPAAYLWLLGLGALNFLGGRSQIFLAINLVGASRSSVIGGASVVFSTIFAVTLAGESPHWVLLAGIAAVIVGLVAATKESVQEGWGRDKKALLGYSLALGAAASYGGANVIAKHLTLAYGSPLVITAFSLLFGVLLLAPFAGPQAVQSLRTAGRDLRFVGFASLSGLASAMAVISLYYALQRADVVLVSPITSTNPLMTIFMARIFISQMENITMQVVAGTGVAVLGIVLVVFGSTL